MNPRAIDPKLIYTVVIVLFVNLTGCASPGELPGNFRFQSNPASSWGGGARSLEQSSAPASRNIPENQRGNTPPGMDRAGNPPGGGAIVDPTGIMTR